MFQNNKWNLLFEWSCLYEVYTWAVQSTRKRIVLCMKIRLTTSWFVLRIVSVVQEEKTITVCEDRHLLWKKKKYKYYYHMLLVKHTRKILCVAKDITCLLGVLFFLYTFRLNKKQVMNFRWFLKPFDLKSHGANRIQVLSLISNLLSNFFPFENVRANTNYELIIILTVKKTEN